MIFWLCVWLAGAVPAHAGDGYTRVTVDPAKDHLSFHWKDAKGRRIGSLSALDARVKGQGRTLVFATNAGIFAKDFTPLGLFIADGKVLRPLNTGSGGGNFFLQPNGVFYVDGMGGHIVRTQAFKLTPGITLATQSGPMLVEKGAINSQFAVDSKNKLIRSGVGINHDGKLVFAISNGPVSFYDFAGYFRDTLDCDDALYLDGVISRMYAPAQGRRDSDDDFVGMIAVTK
ncbi:phosphodiester glycosidase family protein [Asticcacaulis sp. AC460]|uniref:phosphodiester glycosidase family protein n=1 Tax=Asticcacaulis sp. AC460 TaxID=1282360 RepID=UPI00138B09D7|nr:phosphodiester glycosidase family protein [Asticcacaulis sp. AC460]